MLRRDIIDHRDINLTSLTINHSCTFILNVYSDKSHTAISFLRNHELNIDNTIIMTGDFNVWDSDWDLLYPHHSIHAEDLLTIAGTLDLDLSSPVNPGPTRFADNNTNNNSVIDLMFINPQNPGFNNHHILQDKQLLSDHAPLYAEIQITVSNIEIVRRTIKQGSEEEIKYNSYIATHFTNLHSDDLTIPNNIEKLTDDIALIFNNAWLRHSKEAKITKRSKEWWNQSCSDRLADYRTSGQLED